MKKQRGRPQKGTGKTKSHLLQVRLDAAERQSFADAATLAGQAVSVWVRATLRQAAQAALEMRGRKVAFLDGTPRNPDVE